MLVEAVQNKFYKLYAFFLSIWAKFHYQSLYVCEVMRG
jgi:hypothetical protein